MRVIPRLSLDSATVEICPAGIKIPAAILGWRKLASNWESAMDHYLPSFRLEFPGTYNEYRIVEGHVQFRPQEGRWRTMDVEDIRMHFALRTPVASWIRSNTSQTHDLALAM
jgi:hypothetical protein